MKFRPIILTAAAAVVFAACSSTGATSKPASAAPSVAPGAGGSMAPSDAMSTAPSGSASAGAMTDSAAADLRTKLDLALGEHIVFAAKATEAALGGRTAEFTAYGDLLNKNGTDIGAMIGSVYGQPAADQFNQIWSAHNGFFVDYTTGVATKDQAKQDKAVKDLTTIYLPQFSTFLAGATDLPVDAVTALVKEHVLTTKAIVDAQAKGDWTAIAAADRIAGQHMAMLGNPLAKAIVAKLPAKFS